MKPLRTDSQLTNRTPDYVAASLRSVFGAAPMVGSALSEVVSALIPNQRLDRIADFVQKLSDSLDDRQRELVSRRILEPEGTDILEEGLWQTARALSADRRERIAKVIKSGLTKAEINLAETKKVLQLLSQVSDLELILLRTIAAGPNNDLAFKERFGESVRLVDAFFGCSQEIRDANALSISWWNQLMQLGLIIQDDLATLGSKAFVRGPIGGDAYGNYVVTTLGSLVLRSADFLPELPPEGPMESDPNPS